MLLIGKKRISFVFPENQILGTPNVLKMRFTRFVPKHFLAPICLSRDRPGLIYHFEAMSLG
jgi:hypothetical protein